MNKPIFNHRVYYMSSPDDDTVLIALDIKISDYGFIEWFDTIKDRIMRVGEIIDNNSEHFVFQRNDGQTKSTYTLIPMTIDIYNDKIKNKILIPKEFATKEKMLTAFEETKNNAW
ncbi:hypothetical protein A2567_00275 [Candidatus Azambacteria bacterium RIFOXYD1_FULL_42_11]|uniref:Uncharacterized protein n=3 Tax=Candidatus Azamiibacteriota TaxID=1752741 RepID=A0A1F5CJM8_9BACT|nr:MAG: hypothetical protein UV07_C0008G0005 [Candidatus Azambacteria bacterium GW2011_GWB1_42_17]KKS76158.1 MAG: hypothetical protein UV48_C0001G0030 [Candidatus Azambacteria bacterium GW2011_GWA2_42_9]KKS88210.1 MAG: hypothetical protein UV62_C0011G0006 [Parcubacteria group bacterium GW2011_GWC1_43_11]OGD43061.1 MAG: hypothetical protein A2567_00275 [Candidatus Azambacteria bacterium RIFOXYD1_FULL_42_11]